MNLHIVFKNFVTISSFGRDIYTVKLFYKKLVKIEGTGFLDKVSDHSNLIILNSKQMLRLTISLAQVKAGNTSENLLNETRKTIYSLY